MTDYPYFDISTNFILLIIFYKTAGVRFLNEIRHVNYLRKKGLKTKGIIVEIETTVDLDGVKLYRPVIRFKADNGNTYVFSHLDESSNMPLLNAQVPIIYDENNPANAMINRSSVYILAISKLVSILLFHGLIVFALVKNIYRIL